MIRWRAFFLASCFIGAFAAASTLAQLSLQMVARTPTEAALAYLMPPLLMAVGAAATLVTAMTARWRRLLSALRGLTGGDGVVRVGRYSDLAPLAEAIDAIARAAAVDRSRADARRHRLLDLAHELSTPVSTLLAGLEGDDAAGELGRLERLVTDLRQVARDQPDTIEEVRVDLAATGRSAALRIARAFGRDITFDVEPAELAGDPVRLEQAVVNLVSNAMEHTPHGAIVMLRVRAREGAVSLGVHDGGGARAIPSESRGDRGRGLHIVRNIARAHHGYVCFARSELGGLAVTLHLPAHESEARTERALQAM